MNYKYATISKINHPYVGCLYEAKKRKDALNQRMKSLRRELKAQPINGRSHSIRVEMLSVWSQWKEAIRTIDELKHNIEREANKLGLTTTKQ